MSKQTDGAERIEALRASIEEMRASKCILADDVLAELHRELAIGIKQAERCELAPFDPQPSL